MGRDQYAQRLTAVGGNPWAGGDADGFCGVLGPGGLRGTENAGGGDSKIPGCPAKRPDGAGELKAGDPGRCRRGTGWYSGGETLCEGKVFFPVRELGKYLQQHGGVQAGGQIDLA